MKKESNFIKTIKKLEKINDKIVDRHNWSKVASGKERLTEQEELIIYNYDQIEQMASEALAKYEEIIRSLNIQAIVDDE